MNSLRRHIMMQQGGGSGYTLVNSIVSIIRDARAIETDIIPYEGLNFEIKVSLPTAPWKVSPSYDYTVFGSDTSWQYGGYNLAFNNVFISYFLGIIFHMAYSTIDRRSYTGVQPASDTFHFYRAENGECYIDDILYLSGNAFRNIGNIPISLFGLNRNNTANSKKIEQPGVKISYLRMYDSTGDKYMLEAAVRNSDGVPGFYDTLNDTFYASVDAGALGYE